MKTIIGLDPGQSGAIAWTTDGKPCVEKMPETLQDLWELMESILMSHSVRGGSLLDNNGIKAYIESVHSMPGQGVASSFKFGQGFGRLEMALTAAGIPFERVSPQKWQTALGCRTGGDKNVSKRRAQELFPQMKCTHAISDSLLIMEYGRRQEGA